MPPFAMPGLCCSLHVMYVLMPAQRRSLAGAIPLGFSLDDVYMHGVHLLRQASHALHAVVETVTKRMGTQSTPPFGMQIMHNQCASMQLQHAPWAPADELNSEVSNVNAQACKWPYPDVVVHACFQTFCHFHPRASSVLCLPAMCRSRMVD